MAGTSRSTSGSWIGAAPEWDHWPALLGLGSLTLDGRAELSFSGKLPCLVTNSTKTERYFSSLTPHAERLSHMASCLHGWSTTKAKVDQHGFRTPCCSFPKKS